MRRSDQNRHAHLATEADDESESDDDSNAELNTYDATGPSVGASASGDVSSPQVFQASASTEGQHTSEKNDSENDLETRDDIDLEVFKAFLACDFDLQNDEQCSLLAVSAQAEATAYFARKDVRQSKFANSGKLEFYAEKVALP